MYALLGPTLLFFILLLLGQLDIITVPTTHTIVFPIDCSEGADPEFVLVVVKGA